MPEYMGPDEIFKKYGVTPMQIPAYKGLVGDHSDNLKGVTGIGPKAAEALLQQYGTLEAIYEHLPDIKASWRSKLEQGREQAFFCQRMALLKCDIPLPVPMADLAFTGIDAAPVHAFFSELEFTLVARRFDALLQTPYGQQHFIADQARTQKIPECKRSSTFCVLLYFSEQKK
jgi:DNA polymerase-1